MGIPFLDDWSDGDGAAGYVLSSSEDEESDDEIFIYPITDDDMPRVRVSTDEAFAMTTQRFAMLGRKRRKQRQVCHCNNYNKFCLHSDTYSGYMGSVYVPLKVVIGGNFDWLYKSEFPASPSLHYWVVSLSNVLALNLSVHNCKSCG